MLRATAVIDLPDGPPRATLTLDRQDRHRRRIVLEADGGEKVLLDLPAARVLHDGDALSLQNGGYALVRAAPEELMEIRCADPDMRTRIAWHLGNRHAAVEIAGNLLYIAPDHVLRNMVEGLGAEVRLVLRPFEPEAGAYAHAHAAGQE